MDIGSDVRYSVLKEKSSESTLSPDKPDDKEPFPYSKEIILNDMDFSSDSNMIKLKSKANENEKNIFELTNKTQSDTSNKTNNIDADSKIEIDDLDIRTVPSVNYSHSNLSKLNNVQTNLMMNKVLLVLIAILLIFIFVLVVFVYDYKNEMNKIRNEKSQNEYCDSYRCILVSGSIYKSINKQVDPCEDFYEYSCGGWIKKISFRPVFPDGEL